MNDTQDSSSSKVYAFLKNIFYWGIIALQYCAAFCHISTLISHGYIHVPSDLNLPPISLPIPLPQVVTEPWLELPVSRTTFALATSFTCGNVHVSMLFSQFVPPSSSPTGSTSLSPMSACPLFPCK